MKKAVIKISGDIIETTFNDENREYVRLAENVKTGIWIAETRDGKIEGNLTSVSRGINKASQIKTIDGKAIKSVKSLYNKIKSIL